MDFQKIIGLKDSAGRIATVVKSAISSTVVDFVSSTSISLVFISDSDHEMTEVIYSQPIDPNATIYSMKVEIEGRTIESSLREKSDASRAYDDGVKSGHGAYLGRVIDDEPDVYQLCIGNLPPKTQVLVTVCYLSEAVLEDNASADKSTLRISFPVGMFQRYSPATGSQSTSGTSGAGISDIPVDIEVKIQQPCDISSISSKSAAPLQIRYGRSGHQAAVVKSSTNSSIGDFVLVVERVEGFKSSLWMPFGAPTRAGASESDLMQDWIDLAGEEDIGKSGGEGKEKGTETRCDTFPCMLSIFPDLSRDYANDQLSETIFVVDRSGSMQGQYIKAAADTLVASIASLPMGCRFQVIGFGSTFERLFPESDFVCLDDHTKQIAMEHAKSLQADLGGTEVLKPLEYVAAFPSNELPRNVLVITDGGVSNTKEVVSFARDAFLRSGSRHFTFGIGNGASRGLVEGVAKEGGGAAEMIDDSDVRTGALLEKVLRQLARVFSPSLCSVRLRWTNAAGEAKEGSPSMDKQSPARIPSILRNTNQLVYTEIESSFFVNGDYAVSFVGSTPDGECTERVAKVCLMDGEILKKFLAKGKLRDLEATHSAHVASGATTLAAECKARAVMLSMSSGILCVFTSHIAIETRGQTSDAPPRQINIYSARDCGGFSGGGVGILRNPKGGGGGFVFGFGVDGGNDGGPGSRLMLRGAPPSSPSAGKKFGRKASFFGGVKCAAPPPLSARMLFTRGEDASSSPPTEEATAARDNALQNPYPQNSPGYSIWDMGYTDKSLVDAAIARNSTTEAAIEWMVSQSTLSSFKSVVIELLALQKANGSWDVPDSAQLQKLIGVSAQHLANESVSPQVWTTLLIVTFLHLRASSEKSIWFLAASKSFKYILREIGFSVTFTLSKIQLVRVGSAGVTDATVLQPDKLADAVNSHFP